MHKQNIPNLFYLNAGDKILELNFTLIFSDAKTFAASTTISCVRITKLETTPNKRITKVQCKPK